MNMGNKNSFIAGVLISILRLRDRGKQLPLFTGKLNR